MSKPVTPISVSTLVVLLSSISAPTKVHIWTRTVNAKARKKELGLTKEQTVYKISEGDYQINHFNDPSFLEIVRAAANRPEKPFNFYDNIGGPSWAVHIERPDKSRTCVSRHETTEELYLHIRPLTTNIRIEYRIRKGNGWKRVPTELIEGHSRASQEKYPHTHYTLRLDSIVRIRIDHKVYSIKH